MGDKDVAPSSTPVNGPTSASSSRFILQHFKPQHPAVAHSAPHNQDARRPANMGDFPPPIIVDMFYGCPALLKWGMQEGRDGIWSSAQLSYYDLSESGEDGSSGGSGDEGRIHLEGMTQRKRVCPHPW